MSPGDDLDLRDDAAVTSLEPGAGIEAMKERRATVAPTPPPISAPRPPEVTPAEKANTTKPSVVAKKSLTAKEPTPKARREQADAPPDRGDDDLIGQRKGQLRQVTVRLPLELRERLDIETTRTGASLGEAAMDAVRHSHRELRAEMAPPPDDDGFAAPRRKRKRSPDGYKQSTGLFVTPEEARALQDLAEAVMLSVSLTVTECLQRSFAKADDGNE